MKKSSGLAFLTFAAISFSSWATEPPFIVDQPEQFKSKVAPDVDIPSQEALTQAETEHTIHVEHVQFQGGTVFELTELAEIVAPIIGKDVTKLDLVKILRQITQKYKDEGYALSFALLPSSHVKNGKLTIALVEGHVVRSELVIENAAIKKRVEQLAAKMHGEKPLKKATFERYVSLIESIPGYKFKVRVPKPKTINGATTIRVEEASVEHVDTSLGLDNGSAEDERIFAGINFHSLGYGADTLSLSGLVPNDTVDQYYALNYTRAVGSEGLQFDVSVNHFESHGDDRIFVADVPLDYEEDKQRDRFAVGMRYPLLLTKAESWWVGSKLHYLDEEALYQLSRSDGLGNTVDIEKELRYSALEINSTWLRKSSRNQVSASARLKQGLEIGNNKNQLVDANGQRSGTESTHFTTVDLTGTWRYLIAPQWRFQTKTNLFWSDDILPSAEQVRYGGKRYGRAYSDGQAQGDRGAAAELELRYLLPVNSAYIKRVEPYAVFDVAKTELRANDNEQEIASAALGLDITDGKHYGVGVDVAKPVGDVNAETNSRDVIYNLNLRWSF